MERLQLAGASLQGAALISIKGQEINLKHANCTGADFSRSVLTIASFDGADLRATRFTESMLADSTFAKANIRGADFTSCLGLEKADFSRAIGMPASCVGCNLP
mmetsp:Transcript_28387/g.66454  ORF Transcript_28387/g.66454 Transcript_28387/m.66454 type:complete len:104 (-) Transcript_28387:162-473(-)